MCTQNINVKKNKNLYTVVTGIGNLMPVKAQE